MADPQDTAQQVPGGPQPSLMSVDEFASKIKAKYPEYQALDNSDLAQKVIAKYPEYKQHVNLGDSSLPANLPGVPRPVPSGLTAPTQGAASSANEQLGNPLSPDKLFAPLTGGLNPMESVKAVASGFGVPAKLKQVKSDFQNVRSTNAPLSSRANSALNLIEDISPVPSTQGVRDSAGKALDQFNAGNFGGAVGTAGGAVAAQAIPAVVGAVAGGASPRGQRVNTRPPLAPPEAVENIRNAVNPVPQDAPGFVKSLTDQLNTIMSHVSGTKVQDLPSLAQHLASTAKADPYRKTFIEPYKDEHVTTYGGGDTTIGKLDQQLSDINKDLTPRYMRGPDGSVQQVAAVGAEQARALQAQAAQIRQTLAQELSKRTGVPPEQIAAARKNYGQLNDLRDTVQWYADQGTQKANAAAQAPPDTHLTVTGLANKALQKTVRAAQDASANPRSPGAVLKQTFSRYAAQPSIPLTPTPQPGPTPRPAPAWQQGGGPSAPPLAGRPVGSTNIPDVLRPIVQNAPSVPGSAPAMVPAGQEGLLRPGGGQAPINAPQTPLPYTSAPAGGTPEMLAQYGQHETPVIGDVMRTITGGQTQPAQLPAAQGHQMPPSSTVGSAALDFLKSLGVGAEHDAVLPEPVRNAVQNNASGESSASVEALNRAASEAQQGIKRVRIDTRSGKETPLFGPDAVDAKAGPYERIVQRGPKGEVTLDEGVSARPSPLAPRLNATHPNGTPGTISEANIVEEIKQHGVKVAPEDVVGSRSMVDAASKFAQGRPTLGVSDLMREFKLERPAAIGLLDRLETEGVVGPAQGSGARVVLPRRAGR